MFRLLDLPRRSDVEALNRNLERVAAAVETLQKAFAQHEANSAPAARRAPQPTQPATQPANGAPAAEKLAEGSQSR